jgi:methionine synthase I (cobalamin-dependent)
MNSVALPSPPSSPADFVDRRTVSGTAIDRERRQFANQYGELSNEAAELARAIDQYKMMHRRRFINFEEMLGIVKGLGYRRDS